MKFLDDVIRRISVIRTRANLSARELSLRIGKSEAYINRLECRKNFEPSISVIGEIIEACGSTPAEFFYHDLAQYKTDHEIIDLLKCCKNDTKKQAILALLKA